MLPGVDGLGPAEGAVGGQVLYCRIAAEEVVVRLQGQADLLVGVGQEERYIEGRVRVYPMRRRPDVGVLYPCY